MVDLRAVSLAVALWTGSLTEAQGLTWETFPPVVERGGTVFVVAPVYRERGLMEAVWKRLVAKRGQVYLVTSPRAVTDPASYFLSLVALGAGAYLVDPWPLKVEGSFVVVDGKWGFIGPLVAGYPDPESKTRPLSPEEVGKWYAYAVNLTRVGVPFRYSAEDQLRLRILERLGLLRR